ncbi:hypothetical protein LAZ40_04420 [Cereibacter sphaeroides]|uniref:exonuclease domain-containing protein n=1 Tax=Cereibacter sphaeroides TaxID=1063 RepID=UPI001F172F92|nr:exonuclease domain-containing protein [Cereibacter sphaeroides]MCE6958300.1 hypothetical protein [Cereibacter sphaeroides]MCE6971910.1 hypothetical protein [Cereibacter sphaeroides]
MALPFRLVILDTEATGGSPQNGDRVVDLGAVEMVDGRRTGRSWQTFLDPQRPVHWAALRIHGLTNAFLRGKPRFEEKAAEFLDFIDGAPVLAHNAPFDRAAVLHEFHASGLPLPELSFYDTLPMARSILGTGKVSIDALIARLGLPVSPRKKHGALSDADILSQCLERFEAEKPGLLAGWVQPGRDIRRVLRFEEAGNRSVRRTPPDLGAAVRGCHGLAKSLEEFTALLRKQGIHVRAALGANGCLYGFRFSRGTASVTGRAIGLPVECFEEGSLTYRRDSHHLLLRRLAREHDRACPGVIERLRDQRSLRTEPTAEPDAAVDLAPA